MAGKERMVELQRLKENFEDGRDDFERAIRDIEKVQMLAKSAAISKADKDEVLAALKNGKASYLAYDRLVTALKVVRIVPGRVQDILNELTEKLRGKQEENNGV